MSHRILDIVAEDPEEDHVAGEMPEAGVDEGIGKVSQRLRHDFEPLRQHRVAEGDCRDIAEPDGRRLGCLFALKTGQKPGRDIQCDQCERHPLNLDMFQRVGIVKWYEHKGPRAIVIAASLSVFPGTQSTSA